MLGLALAVYAAEYWPITLLVLIGLPALAFYIGRRLR